MDKLMSMKSRRFPSVDMINISFVTMRTQDDMFTAGRSLGSGCRGVLIGRPVRAVRSDVVLFFTGIFKDMPAIGTCGGQRSYTVA